MSDLARSEQKIYRSMSEEEFEAWLYNHGICHPDNVRELPSVIPAFTWIPISEMCPKENGYYLTTTIYKQVYRDYWTDDRFDRTETVIAWMPLPRPFKEGETT